MLIHGISEFVLFDVALHEIVGKVILRTGTGAVGYSFSGPRPAPLPIIKNGKLACPTFSIGAYT